MSLNLPLAGSLVWNCKAQNSAAIKIFLSLDLKKRNNLSVEQQEKKFTSHMCLAIEKLSINFMIPKVKS